MIDVSPKQGKRRKNRLMPPDLTPMVDLGFLLISFFMLNISLTEPKVLSVNMPLVNEKPSSIPDTATITIIPVGQHRVLYYEGNFNGNYQATSFSSLRDLITGKQKNLQTLPETFSAEAHKLHVIIKPYKESTYEDLVNILDEMMICDVKYYVIGELTGEEIRLVTEKKGHE